MQKADPLRFVIKEHQEKKQSNCSLGISTTPTGRKTPHQGRMTPFASEKKKVSGKVYLGSLCFLFTVLFRRWIGIIFLAKLLASLLALVLHRFCQK